MSTNYLGGGFPRQKRVKVDSIAEVRVYVRVNDWPTGSVDPEQVHPIHGLQRCFSHTYGTIYTDINNIELFILCIRVNIGVNVNSDVLM